MSKTEKILVEDYLNCFTLIIGDINSGKTSLTRQILEIFCKTGEKQITVVDLAPEITSSDMKGDEDIPALGGRLKGPEGLNVRYFHDRIHPPRLRARDEREAAVLAEKNRWTIETLFEKASQTEVNALFVNEGSLYLHAGSPFRFLEWIRSFETAVVNGYFGKFFKQDRITAREHAGMVFLTQHCDRLIRK
jgi:hypothetical protein